MIKGRSMAAVLIDSTQRFSRKNVYSAMIAGFRNNRIAAYRATSMNVGKRSNAPIVAWGWRNRTRIMGKRHDVMVFEMGYIGDRWEHISIGWNGLNGYAARPSYSDDGGQRFRDHGGVIKPWREGGDYILILGQLHGDASLKGSDVGPWYSEIAQKAAKRYGKPVYFRPHPQSDESKNRRYHSVDGIQNLGGTLTDALDGALFSITFNSNSSLDSVMNGTPCYAADRGAMAYDICMHDIDKIVYPDREKCLYSIAFAQWTVDEIREGAPMIDLLNMVNRRG